MHFSVKNLIDLDKEVKTKIKELNYTNYFPQIIAVSKTFKIDHINHIIEYGHTHFGENKVQEALNKWSEIKEKNNNISLHMIGGLQSNKTRQAVSIFDYIHSVDSLKLANKIANEQEKQSKKIKVFLQVNVGDEIQKNGIELNNVSLLLDECKSLKLDVKGLMCLPPIDKPASKYFSIIKEKNDELNLTDLSIGMSGDYLEALNYKSSFLRIGTKIFGSRS